MKNLRALFKTIHRIDKCLPKLPEDEFNEAIKSIVRIEDAWEHVLKDREKSIHDVRKDLPFAIDAKPKLIKIIES